MGTDIIRFDLYGTDVLIANKMESNGAEDRVQVSEASYNLLKKCKANQKDKYVFTPNGKVEIKACNKIVDAYFVDKPSEMK